MERSGTRTMGRWIKSSHDLQLSCETWTSWDGWITIYNVQDLVPRRRKRPKTGSKGNCNSRPQSVVPINNAHLANSYLSPRTYPSYRLRQKEFRSGTSWRVIGDHDWWSHAIGTTWDEVGYVICLRICWTRYFKIREVVSHPWFTLCLTICYIDLWTTNQWHTLII